MSTDNKKVSIRSILIVIIILAAVWLFSYPLYRYTAPDPIYDEREMLDSGWGIAINGENYDRCTLSQFNTGIRNKGDVIELERILPAGINVDHPVLRMYSVHSRVKVYLNDDLLYEYGYEGFDEKDFIGYGTHYVGLPDKYDGSRIRIVLTVTENNAFDGIPAIYIKNGQKMMISTISENRLNLAICLFLILFGFFGMILSAFEVVRNESFIGIVAISCFSLLVGIWALCNYDLITLFTPNLLTKVYLEYISLYLLPFPFTAYFKNRAMSKNQPFIIRMMFWIILIAEIIFFAVTCILHKLNIYHFPDFLRLSHVLLVFAGLYAVALSVHNFYRTKKVDKASSVAFVLASILIVMELIRYNVDKYIIGFRDNTYNSTLGFVTVIIVIALLVDFLDYASGNMYEKTRRDILEQMAYTDELTGLKNRRAVNELVEKLDSEESSKYTLITFDMNHLKYINDNIGHQTGDKALALFGEVLNTIFCKEDYLVARTGGDEYLVIIPEISPARTSKELDSFIKLMKKKDVEYSEFPFSASYGVATSNDVKDANFDSLSKLADERMYAMKKDTKQERVD